MGFPVEAGQRNYSNTGANNTAKFIPEKWSTKLVEKFYATTVFGDIANTAYEGEISGFGDKVYIRTRPDITVSNYVKGVSGGLTYQLPESANVELNIDKGKYFAFELKDVDAHQSDLNLMNEWAQDGAEQVQISVDTDILGSIYTSADSDNAGATAGKGSNNINLGEAASPRTLNNTNVIDFLVDCGTVLDKQNIPNRDRYIILPPEVCGKIKTSDLKDASLSGDSQSILRNANGKVGMIDRFMVYNSNNLNVSGGEIDVIFGHKSALTFAGQIDKMEEVPNPNDFGTLARSLFVFGHSVIKPDALGHAVVSV